MAANTLDILVGSLKSPFLEAISNTTQSLLKNMEVAECNSDGSHQFRHGAELPPGVLTHIGKFTETLHKIHTFVEAQQNSSKLKKFFHQSEMGTLFKDCKAGLQQGFEIFQVPMVNHMKDIAQMQEDAEKNTKKCLT
ncbi:hypothetical protein B0H13DRAFT_1935619 [Mycena leptocephala]|nr:hypothetical protein B0H13DRAFT_1935619 [Mycena leptocephala]